MLASSAVISGLVICPVDIREVKISSYDYIGGAFCDLYPDSRHTLGQREYLALAQRWLPTVGQRHFCDPGQWTLRIA